MITYKTVATKALGFVLIYINTRDFWHICLCLIFFNLCFSGSLIISNLYVKGLGGLEESLRDCFGFHLEEWLVIPEVISCTLLFFMFLSKVLFYLADKLNIFLIIILELDLQALRVISHVLTVSRIILNNNKKYYNTNKRDCTNTLIDTSFDKTLYIKLTSYR